MSAPHHAFHMLCNKLATEALNKLAADIVNARLIVADDAAISQTDLRDSAEAAINLLQSLEAVRRFIATPVIRREPHRAEPSVPPQLVTSTNVLAIGGQR